MAIEIYHDLQTHVNNVTSTYLDQHLDQVVQALGGPLRVAIIIYIAGCGWLMLTGRTDKPVQTMLAHLIKVVIIATICLNVAEYRFWVVNLAQYGIPAFFAEAFGFGTQIPLDGIITKAAAIADQFYARGGWTAIGYIAAAFLVIGAAVFCTVIGFFIGVMADFMLAVLLAVGPVFIALALFDATKPFFEKWTSFLLNFVLTKILLALILSLFLGVFQNYIDQVTAALQSDADLSDTMSLAALMSQMLIYSVVIWALTIQVPSFASSLAGGIALAANHVTSGAAGFPRDVGGAAKESRRLIGKAGDGVSWVRSKLTSRNSIKKD